MVSGLPGDTIAASRRLAKVRPPPSSYMFTLTFYLSNNLTPDMYLRATVSAMSSLTCISRNFEIIDDLPDLESPTNTNDLLCYLAVNIEYNH